MLHTQYALGEILNTYIYVCVSVTKNSEYFSIETGTLQGCKCVEKKLSIVKNAQVLLGLVRENKAVNEFPN